MGICDWPFSGKKKRQKSKNGVAVVPDAISKPVVVVSEAVSKPQLSLKPVEARR